MLKLDILAFAAHPDDVELACSGTVIKHIQQGKKVGVIDLTRGELGTRGNVHTRMKEAEVSSQIMKIAVRENLDLPDGFLAENEDSLKKIIVAIRKYQPEIVLCNAKYDRHPDHGLAGQIVSRACFLSGLIKIETGQPAWRPKMVYHYIQDRFIQPDLIIDITDQFEERMKTVLAFKSQFFNADSNEPLTPIATKEFLDNLKGRLFQFGRLINTTYGEGFTTERPVGTDDLFTLK
jgi:bacillithiol biosynthesis deacetylase BshB1